MKRTYLVVYAKCIGSNFSGHAPDVPGCVSAGDTLDEMRAMMREALESHLALMVEEGDPIPEPTARNLELKKEDFEGVEYLVVEPLEIGVPAKGRVRQAVPA
ncbi:MAG: type II toxin-antitoxin system HicB family antitoxin [Terracidiphilus sp.]